MSQKKVLEIHPVDESDYTAVQTEVLSVLALFACPKQVLLCGHWQCSHRRLFTEKEPPNMLNKYECVPVSCVLVLF